MSEEVDELKHIAELLKTNNELLQAHNEMMARLLKIKSLLSPAMETRVFGVKK
jgi:hypothetical protein